MTKASLFDLKESNWKRLKTHRFELAILGWGATEAHNYHLPYGTDVYEADGLLRIAGQKAYDKGGNFVILPTIPFGVNTGQSDIYLDMNLNPSTQLAILKDLITVLDRQGVKKLLVFNSHGGNDFKTHLRELGLLFPEMMLVTCSWFQMLDKALYFEESGDHADEMETSIMMHLHPEFVLPLAVAGSGSEKKHKVRAIREKWAWAERKWSEVSEDTGIGNPSKSSPEKGKRYVDDLTDKIAELIVDLCEVDQTKMYE
ncbi:MAG: hypothetical protein RLZZ242_1207 [Bacteroidota bacterium]